MEREPVESVRNRYIAAALVSLLSFCCGNAIGWLSPNLLTFQDSRSPLNKLSSENDISIMGASLCIGAFIATPAFTYIMGKYGRKITALTCSIPFMISWIIIIGGKSGEFIMIARAIAGAGCSGTVLVVPTYLMEISMYPKTPSIQMLTIIAHNAGILSGYISGTFLSYVLNVSYQISLPVLFFIIFVWIPESPIYLISQKKYMEATEAIAWMTCSPLNNENAKNVLNELKQAHLLEQQNRHKNKTLFTRDTLKLFMKYLIIFTIPCYTGAFTIITYSTIIFNETGGLFSPKNMSIIIAVQQLVSSFISVLFLRKRNKKTKLMLTLSVSSVALFALGTFVYMKQNGRDVSSYGMIPLISGCLILVTFASAISVVPFQIAKQEISPQAWNLTNTFIFMWMWINMFIVTQFHFIITSVIGLHGLFWMFGSFTVCGIVFVFFTVPFNDPSLKLLKNEEKTPNDNTLDTLL